MVSIQIEAQVSPEQLLRAVEQLPPQDFAALIAQILALRALRAAPHLSQEETALLLQINDGIAPDTQRRFADLVARRQAETITSEEIAELRQLTDQIECHDAQRLAALSEVAQVRHMRLTDLMDQLGITPPGYA